MTQSKGVTSLIDKSKLRF